MSLSRSVKKIFNFIIDVEPSERLKLFFLSISFFLVIAGYTLVRTLKDSLFISIVGKEYQPIAKLWSIIILIPAILIFSKLVDVMRRYHLLYLYSLIYVVGGLVIAYYLGDPVIGLANTEVSKYRIFGWIIYFFIEGYNPFVVSLFWSFVHSVTNPKEAKTSYPLMVTASKLGGMLSAGIACVFLDRLNAQDPTLAFDVFNHQVLLVVSSLILSLFPIMVYLLIKRVPGSSLHGYEAAYQLEKQRSLEKHKTGIFGFLKSIFSGLIMLIRYPYVLGIFGVIFFWEVVNVFINYERLGIGQSTSATISAQTSYLLHQDFLVHAIGIIITFFGTRTLIELLGERKSLILVPIITGILLIYYFSAPSANAMVIVFVLARALNYAFASPLRESLYIPTTKEMKFKSKSWIDAFGIKIAKAVGGSYNILITSFAESMVFFVNSLFFGAVIGLWLLTAHFLGRRFERAVKNNEVIGA